jgi:PPOX class probable F420-dependent enzyme
MRLPREAVEHILEHWPVARLATLRPDGAPHVVPIVFARAAGRLYSPIDAKPKRGADLARLEHVRRDPRVSLLLDHWDDDWQRLWWLRLDGRARVVTGRDADLAAVERALRAKYPQYASTSPFLEPPVCLEIEIARSASWCAQTPSISGAGA